MFRLITANDSARLADALGERLRAPRADPLVPASVLVPQRGLARWLQVHLAESLGVVANIAFTPPAQFAWKLLHAAQPDAPPASPFDVDVLRWHLYALLGEPLEGATLQPLRDYLDADGDPLRRFALSGELARVYERMQGYRRDTLREWEQGGGDWQAELWRRVLRRTGGVSRAARVAAWFDAYDPEFPPGSFRDKPAPPGLPAQLSCFACANVSPDVLRMLAVAGRHCDVDFYLPLPSREYVGDAPRTRKAVRERREAKDGGNPLITTLGGAAAEFVDLLYGYEHVRPDDESECFDDEIGCDTLLGRVRNDILQHTAPRNGDRKSLPDDSIRFHACHTELREVQTLHDTLLGLLDNPRFEPPLQPRDIAVMMPDVAAYRPAIEAVFGGLRHGDPQRIPFNLADAGAAALHPVAQLFLDLLDAPTSRWEASELLDVLAAPGVMRRFELDADAVERLSRNVREAGICWGEDADARADCGGYNEFSWAFGLDRMLAGFACGDDDGVLVGGTAPLPGIEGAAFARLDALYAVLETWRQLRALSRHAASASEWQRELNRILDGLYAADPHDLAETRALESVRGALEKLAADCDAADAGTLAWPDVRAFLRDALATPDARQHLFTGGVTFCGLVPLRVVPFRVIALLGMDEEAFPRRERGGLDPLLADRRAGMRQPGDRDVRADDRLLFLQLLCAARDVFYVSWIGRNAQTNKTLPPSVVVAEVMDLLRDGYLPRPANEEARKARDKLLPRVEPLQPFDPSLYGADDTPPRSFASQWLPAASAPLRTRDGLSRFVAAPLTEAPPQAMEITLDELKRFFADPARGFLEAALELGLARDAAAEADVEPLEPGNPLLRYQLTSALLERGDAASSPEEALLRAQGELPPGRLADAALAIARTRAALLRAAIAEFTSGEPKLGDIVATIAFTDGTRLGGRVGDRHPAGLVRMTPGKRNGKRVLDAWIDTLFASAASGAAIGGRLFSLDRGDVAELDLPAIDPADAHERLGTLIAAMRSGLRAPLPLLPRESWGALKADRAQGPSDFGEFQQDLRKAANAEAHDDRGSEGADFREPAVRIAWRGVDFTTLDEPLARTFFDVARALLPVPDPGASKP
ncbi:MAG: exodeoxyribonuclease V subunit gamma [Lysobacterales bacterium]